MARKAAPGTLIHCDACGEDYSSTYRRCPFCGEKSDLYSTAAYTPVKDELPEDDYVFEGGDLFDDEDSVYDEPPARGGKRLSRDTAPAPINWSRLITFLCAIVIIVAALVILFSVVYPKIHTSGASNPGSSVSGDPAGPSSELPEVVITDDPNDPVSSDPGSDDPVSSDPGTDDPGTEPTEEPTDEPSQEPSAPVEEAASGIKLSKVDFTLKADESWTIKATVSPATWSGTVTWTSSDTSLATVDQNGVVTNVNTGKYLRSVTITASAGGQSASATVYCTGGSSSASSSSGSTGSSTGTFKLNREDFSLTLGDDATFQMKATGVDSVVWSVADPSIATIDANGKVTAVSKGKTIITATAPDGSTVTCIVRVRNG